MQNLTMEQLEKFNSAIVCYMCKKKFDNSDRMKMKNKDHCHWSGIYRGAAGSWCNLRNNAQTLILIYMLISKGMIEN